MGKSKIDVQMKIQRAVMTLELIRFHRKNELGHPNIDEYIDESIEELEEAGEYFAHKQAMPEVGG